MNAARLWLAVVALGVAACSWGAASGRPIDFAARRASALGLMDSTTAMVLRSPEPAMRNADCNYRYRQESNLLYLCGLNRPQVALILAPSGIAFHDTLAHVILFARESDDGDDHLPSVPDGIILPPDRFGSVLNTLMDHVATLLVNQAGPAFTQDWLNGRPVFLERESRKIAEEKHPELKIKSAGSLLATLRSRKSADEVDLIRQAIKATGEGIGRAMRACKPGVKEYELQAEIEYSMARSGSWAPAYPSIIGSGPNALILHYELNRRTTHAGEVIVMDVGAEYEGYSADVTRTIPVSGKFTPAQKKIYEIVLKAQRATIAAIKPGLPWKDLDGTARAIIKDAGYDRFWKHSVSHHLGLDTHDAGIMDTLRQGMVITAEPGIYIPENDTTVAAEYRGIGVRIEDDVLVTPDGREILSASIPKGIAQIEKMMSSTR